ncbi:GNAT family N-acetyltransferase [Alteromonas flava]|uniref:GNAT family N-acetyltransferase n=1 Tax=Alteromonas flava TaxID=2048003 RepID=UPI001F0BA283|nr:GNAT family N-acetyltransferase [Alteromonas flava]
MMAVSTSQHITYKINTTVTVTQFIDVLQSSGLAERRPIDDLICLQGMLDNANLTVSAWLGEQLIGIARSVTDFHYACYLSDLAVDKAYQSAGVGKQLQHLTQQQLGPQTKLILLAAPAANEYYAHIGFSHNPRCWVLERERSLMNPSGAN